MDDNSAKPYSGQEDFESDLRDAHNTPVAYAGDRQRKEDRIKARIAATPDGILASSVSAKESKGLTFDLSPQDVHSAALVKNMERLQSETADGVTRVAIASEDDAPEASGMPMGPNSVSVAS
jgi:hypothetical protein